MMYGVNRMAFTGLATGLDTNQIIRDLMRVERMPLERLNQQRQIIEWQREDYREMNRLFTSFRTKVNSLRLPSAFSKQTVSSSNDTVLTTSVAGRPSQSMYSVEVTRLAQAGKHASATFHFTADHPAQKLSEVEGWDGNFSFTINDVTIDVTGDDTVESVVVRINEAAGETDVRAEIVGSQIVLRSLEANENAELNVVVDGNTSVLGLRNVQSEGDNPQQAEIVINGVTLTSDTNRFTYDGLQIDVKQLTAGQVVNLSISQDVDAVFDVVKDFVDAYNELIEKVQEKLGEQRHRAYPPLTDEQRDQLSEKEIEKWEEMARSGLIKNDPLFRSATSALRLDFYTAVEGIGHLSDIGITVGPPESSGLTRYREGGKLYIDEDKLREAISSDPDLVKDLFTTGRIQNVEENYKETGLANRLYVSLSDTIRQLTDKAGLASADVDNSFLGYRLRDVDTRISNMERRLLQVEDRYWRQFTALETAMERLNQQNAWLMGQLGSM